MSDFKGEKDNQYVVNQQQMGSDDGIHKEAEVAAVKVVIGDEAFQAAKLKVS